MQGRLPPESERGAVLLTVLFSMITLLAIAALVLDLAAVRVNRAVSQTVADAAAAAGALDTGGVNGQAGCETALDYLELNLPSVGTFAGADCLSFTTSCNSSTTPATTSATAGTWTATITYPVDDANSLLLSSAISRPAQPLHADDGDPCDRIGVSLQSSYNYTFGRLLGAASQSSEIHAVARSFQPDGADFALNLLILERYDCDALSVGGNGGIIVDAVYNPNTGTLDNGYLAVDSDGTGSCGGNGVIDAGGTGSEIRADGAAGCPGQLSTYVGDGGLPAGEGCGVIQVIAPGTPGCNYPACTKSGVVAPDPTGFSQRLTRAPIDHRYNCKASYSMPLGWEIDGCPDTPATHIDDLVSALGGSGTPAGYTSWTGAGYGCNNNSPLIVPAGNWHIDCNNFRVKKTLIFRGGNLVFDGDITLNASGVLVTNAATGVAPPFGPAGDEATMFMRSGSLDISGSATMALMQTMVYMSSESDVSMTGGGAFPVIWSAPISGDFEDLALWAETHPADSSGIVKLAGGSGMDLEGVFFAPWAEVNYQGGGSQAQVAAQFIARRLVAGGNGSLRVKPDFSRAVLFPFDPQSQLIR